MQPAQVAIVVFVIRGCGACHEYLPRFQRLASRYQHCLPIVVKDANDPHDPLAKTVKYTPTTMIVRNGRPARKWDRSLSDAQIEGALQLAVRGLSCEI